MALHRHRIFWWILAFGQLDKTKSFIVVSNFNFNLYACALTSATVIIAQITDLKPLCPYQKIKQTSRDFISLQCKPLRFLLANNEHIISLCLDIFREVPEIQNRAHSTISSSSFAGFLWYPSYTLRMKTHACLCYDQNLLYVTKKLIMDLVVVGSFHSW